MAFLPSLPDDATLRDVFPLNPAAAAALIDYHEALLRGPSPLAEGERELIAAYVSALNQCRYCHGIHARTASAFGVDASRLERLVGDPAAAAAEADLGPLLAYVRKLTETPARMTEADARAVLDAGFSERALHDAVSVCALFNFMNRLVEGHGLKGHPGLDEEAGRRLHDQGYAPLKRLLEDG